MKNIYPAPSSLAIGGSQLDEPELSVGFLLAFSRLHPLDSNFIIRGRKKTVNVKKPCKGHKKAAAILTLYATDEGSSYRFGLTRSEVRTIGHVM